MVRKDLIDAVARDHPGLPHRIVTAAVDSFFAAIVDRMASGGRVELRGFGSFFVTQVEARTGHNPRNRAAYAQPARKRPRFRATAALRRRLNDTATRAQEAAVEAPAAPARDGIGSPRE